MSEWKTYKLGKIAERITSGGTPSTRKSEYYGGNIPWLRTQEVNFNRIFDTEIKITNEALLNSSAKVIAENSIIVAMYGATAGRIAINKIPLTTNQACCNITIDSKKAEYNFVYYFLKSKFGEILNMATGAAQQNLNAGMLRDFQINLPDLPTQKQIAQILTSLDDKIELNLQMNQTLEATAQAIFKEWFVNFNFPSSEHDLEDYKIDKILKNNSKSKNPVNQPNPKNPVQDNGLPKGWRKEPINENIEFLNGLALQKFPPLNEGDFLPVIKIRELKQGFTNTSDKASTELPEKYVIYDGDILFSWSGSLEVVLWCEGKGALNQHLFKVSSNVYPKWFYFFWVREYLPLYKSIAEGKATTMGHIQRRHLTNTNINVPNKELMNLGDSILSPILDKIQENKIQIQSLTKTRDTLLPKLMSGQLSLNTI